MATTALNMGPVTRAIAVMSEHEPSRRRLLTGAAALSLVGGTAFAFQPPVPGDPDSDLIAACAEVLKPKDWVNHRDFPDTDEAIEVATARDSDLCKFIARTRARTQLGLMWKARVTARENGLDKFINWNGADELPPDDDQRLLLSLIWDVMRPPVAV